MQQTDRTPDPPKPHETEPSDEKIVWLVPRPRPQPVLPDEEDDDDNDPGPSAA